jgi:hypothetical protein
VRKGIMFTTKFSQPLLEAVEKGIRFPAAVPTKGMNKGKPFTAFSTFTVNPDTRRFLAAVGCSKIAARQKGKK